MSRTTVAELTVDELKKLIRDVVEETITDFFIDPDEGFGLRQDIEKLLKESTISYRSGAMTTKSAEQVAADLGLEW